MPRKAKKAEEKIIEEVHQRLARRWPLLLGTVTACTLVGILVVFGGRGIYRHLNNSSQPVPAEASASSLASSAHKTAKAAPATPPASQSNSAGALPNSGPGQVAELFILTSLAAGILHFVVTKPRRTQTN